MAIPSPGCSKPPPAAIAGTLLNETMRWEEPGLPAVDRRVLTYVPTAGKESAPMPLVLVFHGWGGGPHLYHEKFTFGKLAEEAGFLAVYPEGLSDVHGAWYPKRSWNTGDTTVEKIDAPTEVCDPKEVTAKGVCYQSCIIKYGKCKKCSWTTCYDDFAFIMKLLDDVEKRYCIDLSSVFAYGCSNGGVFAHALARKAPGKFKAIAAGCGAKPHRGYETNFTAGGEPVSMVLFQGNKDWTLPAKTPKPHARWWDGYIYASDTAVRKAYKDYNKCSNQGPRPFVQPPHVHSQQMSCTEYGYDCAENSKVVECEFRGGHDLVLGLGANEIMDGPELAWNFFCEQAQLRENCRMRQYVSLKLHWLLESLSRLPMILAFASVLCLLNLLLLWAHRRSMRCGHFSPVQTREEVEESPPAALGCKTTSPVGASEQP
ncbi:Probable feruloyl esterase C (Ferulic acid esterase C-2) [Durusdinium trenchii]|uniref:Probable feruloyl esterase C (Ferulic acid esterase C-2) n=1 Tax=Durusdinium trenchii TaxID=1381693 RepID=A0ABP0JBZ5_9DINO